MAAKKNGGAKDAQASTQPQGPSERKPPVKDFRLGRLRASVWANESSAEGTWFSVTLSRSFRRQDGSWASASSYGRDDLLVIGELCRMAFHWIAEQLRSQNTNGGAGQQQERQPGEEGDEPLPQ